ncbi:FtsX-like permease family protein [Candidatus Micrarchaeota archaeon]|nr:FtsX-like permease family protein [Candidatus Micrarchaeota archaeon]
MNTMYTSVIERTREIGIMKAIGAKNRDIMLLFLIESGVLGLVGGLVGVSLGVLLSKIAQALAEQALGVGLFKPFLPAELIIGALLFSFVIGTLSGVLPARAASRLQPVEALRYE